LRALLLTAPSKLHGRSPFSEGYERNGKTIVEG
jgi:hypothetical protein